MSTKDKKGDGTKPPSSKEGEETAAVAAAEASEHKDVGDRDLLLLKGDDAAEEDGTKDVKMNVLLRDLVHLERVIRSLEGKGAPKKETELTDATDRVYKLMKEGKSMELAGLKAVPFPFLKSPGRVVTEEGKNKEVKELGEKEAKKILRKRLFDELKKDVVLASLGETPYKEFKELLMKKPEAKDDTPIIPASRDALLLPVDATDDDKSFDHQSGNKVIFNLGSQFVSTTTTDSEARVVAALSILMGFDEAEIPAPPDEKPAASKHPRFLFRASGGGKDDEDAPVWKPVDAARTAEFLVGFVFEVILEKEIDLAPSPKAAAAAAAATAVADAASDSQTSPSKHPVPEPQDHDVLFGRGGMTNSHPGNRRFRDIISLHRPDYIRAIKMDKPAVARKIVKAIRHGNPNGRFLKKGDDGHWYDVGDRTAAEKTSQGLRERSNTEKRQRSELRKALRIRKEDLQEDERTPNKKAKVNAAAGSQANAAAAALAPTLNYVGTNLAVPLSLSMTQVVASGKKKADTKGKSGGGSSELNTEGLPPNAVDGDGNVLVTDYDILCGRGGLTNHHKGNKRFRDIVALHRPDYVRAPKIQKPSVARVIVRAIRNGDPPGRFLRKDEKTGKWVDIGDKKSAEKTSQALREKSNEEGEVVGQGAPGAIGVLLPNPASYLPGATPFTATLATATASVMGNILASTLEPPKPPPTEDGKAKAKGKESKTAAKKTKAEEKTEDEAIVQTESV